MNIIPEEPDGVYATIRVKDDLIDVWDCDQYALSLDFAEARRLARQLTDLLGAFDEPGSQR